MFMKKLISSMLIVAMLASSAAVMVNAEETTNPNITAQEVQDEKDIEITVEGKVLTKDVDYTLTYKDNVNAGTATVIINFIGNYSGSKDATFEIKKKSSSGGSHGSSKSPENVSVEDKNNNKITVSVKDNGDTKVITLPSNKTISDDDSYTIIITDKDKKPIPNKKVEVVDKKGNKAEGVTDENGKLVISQTIPSPTPQTSPIPTMTPEPEYEHKAYISGYDNGNFKPDGNITRAETASMLYRVLDTESDNEKLTFSDLVNGAWYIEAVEEMSKAGVINGYTDGTFRPDNEITRAEFVTMIMQSKTVSEFESVPFSDVDKSLWSADYIYSAYKAGYINGYTDGTFKPDSPITRAEAVKIINSVLERTDMSNTENPFNDVSDKHWAYNQILEAVINHNVN